MSTRGTGDHTRWLHALAAPERGRLALATGAGLVTGGFIIAQAGLIAAIVHTAVVDNRGPAELLTLFFALVMVVVGRAFCYWLQQAAGISAAAGIRRRLRERLLDRVGALGPVRLAGDHSAGLTSRIIEQVDALDGYFARYRPQLMVAAGVPLAIALVAASQDWIVALLLVLAAPLIPLFMALVGMGAEHLNRQQFETVTRLAGHFLDRIRALSTLRLFGRTEAAIEEVSAVADEYRQRNMRTLRIAFLSSAVLEFFAAVAIATVAIYVGFGLLGYIAFGNATDLTLFSGLFVLLLAPEFFQPLRTLAQHYHDRAAALGAAEGLRDLLERPGPTSPPAPTATQAQAADIRIHSVAFSHPERSPTLTDASFEIAAGERIALVGPSGCGKSTLLQLLAGFIEPDAGEIRIAGQHAGTIQPIAWVGQRPFLIAGTIRANIALANPAAGDEALRAATLRAGVTQFTDTLPDGLDTVLGEAGWGLSVGQGQRVAIARALLADAPLLLLDEPTASLDPMAEAIVLDAIAELAASGRTLVIATHHPNIRAHVDRVVTIAAGQVRETGP